MKNQISSTIKVHLLRSAFYVFLLLLGASMIPFALAEQTATNQRMVKLGNASPANIIVVTNTNDSGPGSLRQALADANIGDTINFSVTGTITLTSGELALVNKYINIIGPGANLLAVSRPPAAPCFGIFNVANGCAAGGGGTVIQGLTIKGGCAVYGGGLRFSSCNLSQTLTIEHCSFSDNFASQRGGAISNGSKLTVNNSAFSNNAAALKGGGIANGSQLIVNNCTFSNNEAHFNSGGGIFNENRTTVNNSTFNGNTSGLGDGGAAISSEAGAVIVNNSTVSGNVVAPRQRGAILIGGNPRSIGNGVSQINNSTISGAGGCVYSEKPLKIGGTILQTTDSNVTIAGLPGKITSLGYNLSNDNGSGLLIGPGDLINTNPLLGPLQGNGGPTFTHALLPGSPAIDTGNPNFIPPPDNDQRGCPFLRVYNGRIDIGSFELQPSPPPCTTPRPTPTPRP